jgi:hypothetical protein
MEKLRILHSITNDQQVIKVIDFTEEILGLFRLQEFLGRTSYA